MCVFLKCVLAPGDFDSQVECSASTSEKIRVSMWKVPVTHRVSWSLWCVCVRERRGGRWEGEKNSRKEKPSNSSREAQEGMSKERTRSSHLESVRHSDT